MSDGGDASGPAREGFALMRRGAYVFVLFYTMSRVNENPRELHFATIV